MMHTTRWSPDTCGCVVEYEWDDKEPPEERTHSIIGALQRCPRHALLSAHSDHWTVLTEENSRKNRLLEHLLDNDPALSEKDPEGNPRLKDGAVSWNFDDSGTLHVVVPSLGAQAKATAQRATESKFGAGKIVLD